MGVGMGDRNSVKLFEIKKVYLFKNYLEWD